MIGDLEEYKRMYGDFGEPGLMDMVYVLIVLLPFFAIYLYVRFVENRLVAFVNFRLIPFVRYKMRLNRVINFFDRILKTEIFAIAKK